VIQAAHPVPHQQRPGSKPGLNQDELRLELHFFF